MSITNYILQDESWKTRGLLSLYRSRSLPRLGRFFTILNILKTKGLVSAPGMGCVYNILAANADAFLKRFGSDFRTFAVPV